MSRKQIKFILLPLCIFILALFLRFYALERIPNGLYQDETAIGYNAFSLVKIGKDEHGKVYPLYFESFGDYKLPIYIYTTAFSIKLFGANEFAVRFPSAIFGSLSVLILFILVYKLSKNTFLSSASSIFLCLTPWHLHFSRAGFEVNLALFFVLLGSLTFILGIQSKKYFYYFFLTSILFLLAEYSYNVTRLLSPALLIGFIFCFRDDLRKIPRSKKITLSPLLLIVFVPFILTFFISSGISATTGNLLLGPDTIAKNIEFIGYLSSWPNILVKLFFNKWILLLWHYLENMLLIFSPKFLFIEGSTHGNHGIGNVGEFYLFQAPLIMLGIVFTIKNKIKSLQLFFYWFVLTILIVSLSKEIPHATRSFFLVVPLTVFSAYGSIIYLEWLRKTRSFRTRNIIRLLTIGIISYSVIYYFTSYYFRFPVLYAHNWASEDKKIAQYLMDNEKNYQSILIDKDANLIYTSLLFYQQYDPTKLITTQKREPANIIGYYLLNSFGKYKYQKINWDNITDDNILIIVGNNNSPINIASKKVFYYPTRTEVVSANGQIGKVELTDIVYKVYDSKNLINFKK